MPHLFLSFFLQIRLRDDDNEKIKNIEELARKALSTSPSGSGRKMSSVKAGSVGGAGRAEKKKSVKRYTEDDEHDDDDTDLR